ncbi:MAG TPA: hypothetical protein VGM27_08750 [Acidobacteriaceae bacterium]
MRRLKYVALAALAGLAFFATSPETIAQISVNIGQPPVCPYGYYDIPPYACAPYGYYGPEWFSGAVFIGAGPWFRGRDHFYGHVDNHFHPDHGYHGPMPGRGEAPRAGWNGHVDHFHGNEVRDGHGHVGGGRH